MAQLLLKTEEDIERIAEAGSIAAECLIYLSRKLKPGINTLQIDRWAGEFINDNGGISASKGYHGYPAEICISPNNVIVHGIPSKKIILKDGDILSLDIAVKKNGFIGDTAATYPVGEVNDDVKQLLEVTEKSIYKALSICTIGSKIAEIGKIIEEYVNPYGFGIVRDYAGHGVGYFMHEKPNVPNYDATRELGYRLGTWTKGNSDIMIPMQTGMVFTIEPMINQGTYRTRTLTDGWTVVTSDGKLSAHFEHTLTVSEKGVRLLTLTKEEKSFR
ncbi:MAG: type I methionyl aminopeptidase [Candidatus Coatesbacteria bacterium]|nr:type I methionyl aminopeptidase [Candidatus Coatesbacteria bacterium]